MKDEIVLDVPYEEKEEVKMLGARWDPEIKKWYVPDNKSAKPFARWIKDSEKQVPKADRHKNNTDSRPDH